MLDTYLIRYFLSVVETGSFTAAADRCNVTQPTLSAGIKKLEQQLSAPLFHRTSRRVQLTQAGTRFLGHAQRIMEEYNHAIEAVAASPKRTLLRVGLSHTLPAARLAKLAAHLTATYPDLELELGEGTAQELSNRLAQGRIDCALIIQAGTAEDAVFTEGYSVALPKGHRLSQAESVAAEDLADEAMIVRRRCEVLAETSRHFISRNVRPPLCFRTTNDEKALEQVAAGLGVTVIPNCYAHPGVAGVAMEGFGYQRHLALKTRSAGALPEGFAEALKAGWREPH